MLFLDTTLMTLLTTLMELAMTLATLLMTFINDQISFEAFPMV